MRSSGKQLPFFISVFGIFQLHPQPFLILRRGLPTCLSCPGLALSFHPCASASTPVPTWPMEAVPCGASTHECPGALLPPLPPTGPRDALATLWGPGQGCGRALERKESRTPCAQASSAGRATRPPRTTEPIPGPAPARATPRSQPPLLLGLSPSRQAPPAVHPSRSCCPVAPVLDDAPPRAGTGDSLPDGGVRVLRPAQKTAPW